MSSNSLNLEKQTHIKQLVLGAFPKVSASTLDSYVEVVARKPQDAIDILAATSKDTSTRNAADKVTSEVMRYLIINH